MLTGSHCATARHFKVSPKFVNDMVDLRRDTGPFLPERQGNLGRAGKLNRFKVGACAFGGAVRSDPG
jgi:hypothetical protein